MGETMMDPKVFPLYVWGSFPLQQLFTGESPKARPRQNEGNDGDAVRHQDKTGSNTYTAEWLQLVSVPESKSAAVIGRKSKSSVFLDYSYWSHRNINSCF